MSFSQHTVLYSSQKSRQVVKIIVNVELVVVVVVVRLVVVNGWRRRGDKSTATAARPLPTTAIDQGGPASSQFNRLNPPTSCLQVQLTTHRLQEWRRTAACPEMYTLLITFRQKTHWQRIIPQSIKKFPLSPNSTRKPREPGWARRSWMGFVTVSRCSLPAPPPRLHTFSNNSDIRLLSRDFGPKKAFTS